MDSKRTFFLGLLSGLFIGLVIAIELSSRFESKATVPKSDIADCAIVPQPELRLTEGIASYRVTFQDGEDQDITCLNAEDEVQPAAE